MLHILVPTHGHYRSALNSLTICLRGGLSKMYYPLITQPNGDYSISFLSGFLAALTKGMNKMKWAHFQLWPGEIATQNMQTTFSFWKFINLKIFLKSLNGWYKDLSFGKQQPAETMLQWVYYELLDWLTDLTPAQGGSLCDNRRLDIFLKNPM